jgi:hypothetical protein
MQREGARSNRECRGQGWVFRDIVYDLSGEGIPEDSDAAADNRVVIAAEWLPRKAETRRPLDVG